MYFLLGTSLMVALLLVLNLLISAAANVLWRVLSPIAESWTARRRAQTIFALRIFPFASALIFVAFILLPAYLLFEPHSSGETVSFKLGMIAIASTVGILAALYRVFGTWWKTRRLVSNWLENAETIEMTDVEIPTYRMEHSFPVIAIVGVFRPQMFIASQIFDSLNERELRAAIAHEYGHLAAHDNFKRTLMRVCRDLLVFPFGRSLDNAWAENVESSADEYAARTGGNLTALNLASALVKIARIVPNNSKPTMPSGAFLLTEQTDFVTWRVRRLLQLAEINFNSSAFNLFGLGILFWISIIGILASVTLLATNQDLLLRTHTFMENIVSFLS